jgi:hypothetical protein
VVLRSIYQVFGNQEHNAANFLLVFPSVGLIEQFFDVHFFSIPFAGATVMACGTWASVDRVH